MYQRTFKVFGRPAVLRRFWIQSRNGDVGMGRDCVRRHSLGIGVIIFFANEVANSVGSNLEGLLTLGFAPR